MPERVAPSQGALAGGGGIEVSRRWRQMDHDSLTCDPSCMAPSTSPETQKPANKSPWGCPSGSQQDLSDHLPLLKSIIWGLWPSKSRDGGVADNRTMESSYPYQVAPTTAPSSCP